ncbi:MAG: hypothetical protein H6577_26430 [Lewinellaceae bacterium]|nr:hypothetical protein [Saprospiraceae bacterium]MCB9341678.1 hypothetical protein [Lewinellaceae bacterium]
MKSKIHVCKNILFTAILFGCTLLAACTKNEDPLVIISEDCTTTDVPTKPCQCKKLLLGYFEMEDCILYLPGQQPFSCQGYDLLELAWNFDQRRATFRSTEYQFCKAPVELWAYGGEPSLTAPWTCQAEIVEAQLDFNGHEIDLELDEGFPLCAFEEDGGFWFVLPVE